MDELQKLYDLLFREGKYTKSFDEFKAKWSSEEGYQDRVFDVVSRDGFYTKDRESFIAKYGAPELKKKEEAFGPLPAEGVPSFTEFPSEVGPSVSPEPTKPKEEQGWLLNMVSAIDKGAYNLPGEAVMGVGTFLEGVTGRGYVSDALKKFGTSYLKAIEELTPQDESFKNTLSDQFGQAFGQVAGMVLTSGASQAAKATTALSAAEAALASQAAPKVLTVGGAVKKLASEFKDPAAVSMGLAMGQGEFDRAKASGATDEEAFEAFYKNAVVGSVLENIPVMQFLKRFNKASAGGVANYLKTKAIGGITGGTEEMTTEVLQQLYANQTAKDIYNINQDLFEGVGESGGVGFGVGFLLNAMGANAKLLRKEGKTAEAEVIEEQMKQFENAPQVPAGPPPSYSVAGIKITDPVVINDMIDNMDVVDLVKSNIEITNDPELNTRLQDKIVTSSIKEQVREANPNLTEEQLDEVTNLEKELRKFEGNTTQSGKDRAAAIRSQIKTIQQSATQQQTEGVSTEQKPTLEKALRDAFNFEYQFSESRVDSEEDYIREDAREFLNDPKAYFEKRIRLANSMLGGDPNDADGKRMLQEYTDKLNKWNEITNKYKQDAIQKQAAGEVPVQPRAGVSETLEEGKPQAEPEGVTAEGVEEVVKEKIKPIDFSNQIEQKYGVQVDLLGNLDKGDLTLSRIVVPEEQRGTGIGTDVMNEIVKYADDNNKRITLTPSTDFGGESVERLTGFYKQFGFIENKGENKDFTIKDTMYRSPEVSLKTQPEIAPEVMIDELLTADTKDATVLEKVRNFLDKAEADLDKFGRETTGINLAIPVVKVIIKTVKALVNTGITLQEAIRRAAAENNVSEEDVINSIKSFSEQRALEIKPEIELPGYNRMIEELQGVVEKSKQRGVDEEGTMNNAMSYLQGSKVYEDASDTQREQMIRDVRTMFAAKEKAAPSVRRLFGEIKDVAKVTMTEKSALVKQIKDLARGARDAKKAIASATQSMAKEINDLSKRGIVSLNQASNIISKFSKVNPLSSSSVSKFVDYTTKVFADAEYASKLNNAKGLRKDIKKLSKDKNKDANLRDLGIEFSKIEPSMVDDINAYNDMASKIKEAIKGSTIRGQKVSIADTVNINSALEYTKKSIDAQDKLMREEKAAEIQDLMGIDVSELSYDDMMALLESKEPITKYNEDIIRSTINKAFGVFSSVINETISTGKDPFTGEDVEFTKAQKDLINRFMGMNLDMLKPKEALQAVDALANFIQNKSTAKMETVVRSYTGSNNARQLAKEGVRAYRLQKYWSPALGRFLGEQITNLPTLIEKMFKGFNAGGRVMDMMGLTELINNKASAQTESNKIIDKYVKQFYDKKPNGEAFNTEYNNVERGMAAFMMRNIIGTEAEMNKEFERRKNLLLKVDKDGNKTGSIAELEKGDEKERAKAELYQRAYDKIFSTEITPEAPAKVLRAEPKNAKDIAERIDPVNLQAINFWKNEWSDRYDRLSDVSQNIYNKILEKDINFIPDRFARLSSDTGIVELSNDDSAFHSNNGTLYQKETGSLMKATRPESLPVNAETNETNRYVDLSFDAVNANAMYDALMDINTAAPIKQIQGFLNSPDFKKIFPNTEDAKIIKGDKDRIGRVDLYIRNFRRKNPYSSDEMSNAIKNLNRIASIGVGQALGGISQPLKQVIPVAMNTLINAGSLDLSATFNKDKNDFISNSGYAIANRGVESQAQIESINKLLDTASKSKGEKTLKAIEEANQLWLKAFLVKPDVFIARASWLTYYEQYLKDNGIDTKNIDYKNHELNKNAANYAQRMVDRQQNVSDADLSGKLLTSKDPTTQFLMKTLMPLSSFRMAQSSRLGADLATLMNKTSTDEDKKIASKSVSGYGVELVTFRMMQILSTLILGTIAKKLMDREEDEEQKKKRVDNVIKGARTGTFTDIVSPLPIMDKVFQEGGNILLDQIEKTSGLPVSIFGTKKEDFFQNLGLFGIPLQRADQLWELSKLTTTGNYTDDFGRQKTISDKSQDELRKLAPFAIMSNIGLAPSEFNTVIRYAISDAKKKPSATAEEKEAKMERKEEREENLEQKLDALEELRKKTRNKNIIEAIDEKIDELEATDEEKKIIKEENKEERELKKELLTDPNTGIEYDNESELKRYNKRLWNKNFGPRSEWFKEHKYEKEAEKLMNKEIRKQEDKEQRYIGPIKKRNSDGSLKRTYGKKTR